MLQPLKGDARPLREWLTTFHLASVVIDPFTNESAWILETAARVLHQFADALGKKVKDEIAKRRVFKH